MDNKDEEVGKSIRCLSDEIVKEGNKVFGYLVENNCKNMIKILIDSGIKVEKEANMHIMMASEKGYIQIVEMLIDAGCNPTDAIVSAVNNGYFNILKLLEQKGVDIGKYINENEYALICVYKNADVKMLKYLIRKGVQVENKYSKSILYAINNSDNELDILKVIKILVKKGLDFSRFNEFSSYSLIEEAVKKEYIKVACALIENGVNCDEKNLYFILSAIVKSNNIRLLNKVLKNIELIPQWYYNHNLTTAIENGYYNIAKMLVEHGKINFSTFNKSTLEKFIRIAIYNNYKEIIQLLTDNGVDMNLINQKND